jgi:hypothetical protein
LLIWDGSAPLPQCMAVGAFIQAELIPHHLGNAFWQGVRPGPFHSLHHSASESCLLKRFDMAHKKRITLTKHLKYLKFHDILMRYRTPTVISGFALIYLLSSRSYSENLHLIQQYNRIRAGTKTIEIAPRDWNQPMLPASIISERSVYYWDSCGRESSRPKSQVRDEGWLERGWKSCHVRGFLSALIHLHFLQTLSCRTTSGPLFISFQTRPIVISGLQFSKEINS